jgi:cytochrome c-type biogenesis protein CcmF
VGPLLPWRATSLKSIRRNFVLPVAVFLGTLLIALAIGRHLGQNGVLDRGSFYALVAFALAAAVLTATFAEFARGACVVARQTGGNPFAILYRLIRLNPRRYGGYLIHIGVVLIFVGLAGAAFNSSAEREMALNDKLAIGPYTLQCAGFTQESNANYDTEYALLDVYRNGSKLFQMTPEKREYLASQQPQTMVAIHSVPLWDLYVVYEGANPENGRPIIKAFLNPLVSWIWIGVVVMVLGTLAALLPSQKLEPKTEAAKEKLAAKEACNG